MDQNPQMSSSGKDRGAGVRGARRPIRGNHPLKTGGPSEQGPSDQPGRRRTIGYVLVALILSVVAGVALVRFNPLFALGAIGCASVAYIVVTRPFLGLLFYTILFWWRPGELYRPVSSLHLERVVGALALLGMYLEQFQRERRLVIDRTRQTAVLLVMAALVLISALYAYVPSVAMNGTIDFIKLVAWYLLIVHLINTRVKLRVFLGLWFACVGKIALDSMRAYFFGGYTQYAMGVNRAIGQSDAGGDANHLAATMSASIPILLLLTFHKPLRWWRIPAALGVLLFTLTMSLTGSRSGLIGFFTGLIFLWWHCRRRLVVGLIGLTFIGGGLVVLPDQYKARYATIGSKQIDSSSQGRLDVWQVGLRMVADHPITGVGIGCFSPAHAERYSPDLQSNTRVAHSLYVEVLSELGVLGALAFFTFVFEVFRLNLRARRALRVDGRDWQGEWLVLQGLAAGVFLLLFTGIFGTNFARHTWYVYGALGAAIWRLYVDRDVGSGVGLTLGGGCAGQAERMLPQ
jgi:putative inorganic carbon (hco3(-)) transporter